MAANCRISKHTEEWILWITIRSSSGRTLAKRSAAVSKFHHKLTLFNNSGSCAICACIHPSRAFLLPCNSRGRSNATKYGRVWSMVGMISSDVFLILMSRYTSSSSLLMPPRERYNQCRPVGLQKHARKAGFEQRAGRVHLKRYDELADNQAHVYGYTVHVSYSRR